MQRKTYRIHYIITSECVFLSIEQFQGQICCFLCWLNFFKALVCLLFENQKPLEFNINQYDIDNIN